VYSAALALCLLQLSFGELGTGHHLLTSTYGNFSNVCSSNSNVW
jgi:hypothetical protein